MGGWSLWQHLQMIRSSSRSRLAPWYTAAGVGLSVVTVIVSALNAISAQQAVALALPAGMMTLGGLVAMAVPDAWVAWRRGFEHGCEAAARSDQSSLAIDVAPPKASARST